MQRAPRFARSLTVSARRKSIRAFVANAMLWGVGNGLVSSSLIVYLANEFGAQGSGIGLILATPRLAGVLRLATPKILSRVHNPRRFASLAYLGSAMVLLLLPAGCVPGQVRSNTVALAWLVLSWTLYHLLEFAGSVALWDWIGRTVPRCVRGRFLGRRNGWLNLAQVAGMLLGAATTVFWNARIDDAHRWIGYAICNCGGAVCFALATVPLMMVDSAPVKKPGVPHDKACSARHLAVALLDRRFRRLLYYGGWFSFANGICGAAQFLFQLRILDVAYGTRLVLDGTSQACQSALMPWIGTYTDRHGTRTCLVVSQVLVACGLVFFPLASQQTWWLIGFGYLLWVAYAGINVALPKIMLDFTHGEAYATYAAVWFAWSQVVYACSTLCGGILLDWLLSSSATVQLQETMLDPYHLLLWNGVALRFGAVPLAARIDNANRVQ